MAPSKEYLLLLAHPAIRIPITDKEDTADTYNTPILISHNWKPFAKAIGANSNIATNITKKGARLNKNLYALSCVSPSFINNFKVSATVWNIPPGPTLFGPKRIWIC